jgi:hypothetical protein
LYKEKIANLKLNLDGEWKNPSEKRKQEEKPEVIIKYCEPTNRLFFNPITAEELRAADLDNIGPLRFTRADIYKLVDYEADKIERLIQNKING